MLRNLAKIILDLTKTYVFLLAPLILLLGAAAIGVYARDETIQPLPLSQAWPHLLAALVILSLPLIQYFYECNRWNNGICKENGLAWELAWVDSGNGRCYKAGNKEIQLNNIFVDS